jgi:hypothetical protein
LNTASMIIVGVTSAAIAVGAVLLVALVMRKKGQ